MADRGPDALRRQLERQVRHWSGAIARLERLEDRAPAEAWDSLEGYLGVALRRHLTGVVATLAAEAARLRGALAAAHTAGQLEQVRRRLLALRRRYFRTETTLDFYGDSVNTRVSPEIRARLSALDAVARASMTPVLGPAGIEPPPVLTYIDRGLGASILKAGMRLWDGDSVSPAAAIKIVFHNLRRPTALIHEAGHQVAHLTGWNDELAGVLEGELAPPREVAEAWAGWASEIAADAFAFAHTGYPSVAALHDVLAGEARMVFRNPPGDPHPIPYLRVLLGAEMCRAFHGPEGRWTPLAEAWRSVYPLSEADPETRRLIQESLPLLPRVAAVTLRRPMRSFGGRALASLVDPRRASPAALAELSRRAGPALLTSPYWAHREGPRALAVEGLALESPSTHDLAA
ncbi:MAG: hypothetical protein R3325_04065 [Thermoanaerobaculia bacterium]|nr:hypothetical protein [Thermoanaerobaculia bacterium]